MDGKDHSCDALLYLVRHVDANRTDPTFCDEPTAYPQRGVTW